MTTPKQTNAQLLRRAEEAERQLQFEQIRVEALRDIVELKMRLEAIEKALRGEI